MDTLHCWKLGKQSSLPGSYILATVLFLRKKRTEVGGKPEIFDTLFKKKVVTVACALEHTLLNEIIEMTLLLKKFLQVVKKST